MGVCAGDEGGGMSFFLSFFLSSPPFFWEEDIRSGGDGALIRGALVDGLVGGCF